MANVVLGGIPLTVNPDQIRWNFQMKTTETRTMGGKVIQILGTTLSDLTISGAFGRGERSKGDTEGWQSQVRFRAQVAKWTRQTAATGNPAPLTFTYTPRGWNFQVFVRSFSDVDMTNEEINPQWQLVLFPLDDGATDVIRGIKDLYIKRLMDGVGWKQTAYNGPTQGEVDNMLAAYNGSIPDYLRQQFTDAFSGAQGNTQVPGGGQ